MTIREEFRGVRFIKIASRAYPVEKTAAEELRSWVFPGAVIERTRSFSVKPRPALIQIAVFDSVPSSATEALKLSVHPDQDWVYFGRDAGPGYWLMGSRPHALYAGLRHVLEDLVDAEARPRRWFRRLAFPVEKSTFDLFLTQYARLIRNFDREAYVRELGRLGFSHVEVNALAGPFPCEYRYRRPGEFYPDFYTYCPGLDQFVSSRLNQGLYPREYLKANLGRLKQNARLALKYGLAPGLLCFEPRSVPEVFFDKYPTLRGARVDHPFRSFRPRYSLALAHPAVQEHYVELLTKLLGEVPELEFLSIWSNDSGSGFEHTKSLYVGRNGGAYLIREWKNDDEIARAAADNIGRFFRLLRDAAARSNPRFRVSTRLESFYGEHRYLWPQLRDGVDAEVNSLRARGWENNYEHPRYRDIKVLGSALHNTLGPQEAAPLRELRRRGSRAYFYHYLGPFMNHEPILGVPFPWLVHEKLRDCYDRGVKALAHHGGIHPADRVPLAVNQEVFRLFQFDPHLDLESTLKKIAARHVGPSRSRDLVRAWRLLDAAVRSFPPMSIYSGYGVVWQRMFVRPLVPDIDRIPEAERAYYEKFMCTSVHNPNRIDLARDVLFELLPVSYAGRSLGRINRNVWPPLERALALLEKSMRQAAKDQDDPARRVFEDQYWRARALRCLYRTLRNTAAWVYGVHGYLEAKDRTVRVECRRVVREMVKSEISNARDLLDIWSRAPLEWMIVSGCGETPFIYGQNFPLLLRKKIRLMEKYGTALPRVDPEYMFRMPEDPQGRS